jgi:uncharacterized membrane protein YgcG
MESLGPDLLKLVQIIWINIILSGDNAVVIALACRGLPENKQKSGMMIGALVAVVMRIVFTVAVATLLATPFLKIIGGCLLPVIKDAMAQVVEMRMAGREPESQAVIELVRETLRRFDERIDIERFLPKPGDGEEGQQPDEDILQRPEVQQAIQNMRMLSRGEAVASSGSSGRGSSSPTRGSSGGARA